MSRRRKRKTAPNSEGTSDSAASEPTHAQAGAQAPAPNSMKNRRTLNGATYAAVALLSVGFATGGTDWALAACIVMMGIVALVFPPRAKLPTFPAVCLLVLCGFPLLSLLPSGIGGGLSDWRNSLSSNWDIQLTSGFTSQPLVTIGALIFLWLGSWYLVSNLAQGYGTAGRRLGMQTLSVGLSMVCMASVAEAQGWIEISWWPRSPLLGGGFGPFQNRNHLATLASAGTVLTLGCMYDCLRRRSPLSLVFLLSSLPIFSAVVLNTSRAGLLLTFVGMTSWIGFVAMRKGFIKKLAVASAAIMMGVAAVIVSGGSLAGRLGFTNAAAADLTAGTRLDLYLDTLRLFADTPWMGIGLGNFDPVFNYISEVSSPLVRYLHPESDFFQLLLEGGMITVLCVLLLTVWLIGATGPWQRGSGRGRYDRLDRRLRQSAAIAAGLMLIHAMVDVPLHGIRFFTVFACTAGLAMRPRAAASKLPITGQLAFRVTGVLVIAFSIAFLSRITPQSPRFLGQLTANACYQDAGKLASQGQVAEAYAYLERAISIAPLDWRLYWMRAQLKLIQGKGSSEAILDFGRARALEPNYAAMCFEEGEFWLDVDPPLAIPAWREYLARDDTKARQGRYNHMLHLSLAYPEVRNDLWQLADTPKLKLIYLRQNLRPEDWNARLRQLLSERPDLDGLSSEDKSELFKLWNLRGDQDQLVARLSSNIGWQEFAWQILADHLASKSLFQEAYEIATEHLPETTLPSTATHGSLSDLEKAFLFSPTDPRPGMELYWAQKAEGLFDEALLTLSKLEAIPQAPSYLPQEFASVHAAKGEYRKAWEYLKKTAESN